MDSIVHNRKPRIMEVYKTKSIISVLFWMLHYHNKMYKIASKWFIWLWIDKDSDSTYHQYPQDAGDDKDKVSETIQFCQSILQCKIRKMSVKMLNSYIKNSGLMLFKYPSLLEKKQTIMLFEACSGFSHQQREISSEEKIPTPM